MEDNFNIFIGKFSSNKGIIRDFAYKTIRNFMQIFKDGVIVNEGDFNVDFIFKRMHSFTNETDEIQCVEDEYLNLIYIEFILDKIANIEFKKKILKHLFNVICFNFKMKRILINFKIFKKSFNFVLNKLISIDNNNNSNNISIDNYIEFVHISNTQISNDPRQRIINFLLYIHLYTLVNFTQVVNPQYIDILFELNSILQFYLSDSAIQNQISQSVQNSFNYIFNKHFFNIKDNHIDQYQHIVKYFISKLSNEPIESYDNYIYILSDLLKDKMLLKQQYFLPIIKNTLINNNGHFHKISVNTLNDITDVDQTFLKKYISVYDVLDGFNSHLFKSLHNELDYIINFIDEHSSFNNYYMAEDGFFYINENYMNIFELPINYFIFLSRKIFNHANSRIQKFFIKTISQSKIKNIIFANYLTNDFLYIINSPILYPENETVIYHSKMGLIIKKFFIGYLNENFNIIFAFLNGISNIITNRRIFVYLMETIREVIALKGIITIENSNFINSFERIIDSQMKTFSYYNKHSYWLTICELINKAEIKNMNSKTAYNKIFNDLVLYLLNSNREMLSVDYLYFGDDEILKDESIFMITLRKMLLYIKNNITFYQSKRDFIRENNFESEPTQIINTIYNSLGINFNIGIISDYINDNIDKVFSPYLPNENKLDIMNNIISILILSKIFKKTPNVDINTIENVYANLKSIYIANNITSKYNTFIFENFCLFEQILFLHLSIYKQGSKDLLINTYNFTKTILSNQSEIIYLLKFLQMNLFNFLSCAHYSIYALDTFKNNTTLYNNIINIYTFLIYLSNNSNSDKILLIRNLSLCLMIMRALNINISNSKFININESLSFFDIVSNIDLFYVFKYFNIFFNINHNDNNIETFEMFIHKGIKVLTEKRDNFTYVNVLTFLYTLLSKDKISLEPYAKIISNTIEQFIQLNDNRIWLLLKLSTEILISELSKNTSLLYLYSDVIIQLSTVKESRGEDAMLLNTSPSYIKSPFNFNVKKILPFNEDIAKYGLYVRFGILKYFESLINSDDIGNYIDVIMLIISKIVALIEVQSCSKPEMQFTEKHRKKLRLSQFLLCLGSLFLKKGNDIAQRILSSKYLNEIENKIILLLQKINLYSVDFYIYNFCMMFINYSVNFRLNLLNVLRDPKSKPFLVTACIIISSIGIIENIITDKNEYTSFINAITIQCTSNICNIRGFAQYFISKINSFSSIKDNYLSTSFLNYLESNPNIQKFFKKFDSKYQIYISLLKSFSVEKLLKNNFDEIYNEIIPIDLENEFKVLSSESMILDNQDYTKASSSWRFVFTDIDKDKHLIDTSNKQVDDFQKKYRPIDIDIYHNVTRKRLDIIVMASLVDKLPNLGGLARTCEVFNIGALTIASETVLKEIAFLSAAASAEKWMPLITVAPVTIKEFLISYRKMGYTIIGLEQTQNSVDVKKFKFKEKTVIVLGNEKEGIPQEIINLIDTCVVIKQYGEIRSLNVHVSAAIMIWEVVNCILG